MSDEYLVVRHKGKPSRNFHRGTYVETDDQGRILLQFRDWKDDKYVNNQEWFEPNEVRLNNPISKKDIVGKWLWQHTNHYLYVVGKAPENGFYIVEEPGSPWGPRPVHYDNLKYGTIIDKDAFKVDEVTSNIGKVAGFCSCHAYKVGKDYIEIAVDSVVDRWDLDKVEKEFTKFFFMRAIKCEFSSHEGRIRLRFIDMTETHNDTVKNEG